MKLSDFAFKPKTNVFYKIKYIGGTVFEEPKFKGYRRSHRDNLLSKVVFHRIGIYR